MYSIGIFAAQCLIPFTLTAVLYSLALKRLQERGVMTLKSNVGANSYSLIYMEWRGTYGD